MVYMLIVLRVFSNEFDLTVLWLWCSLVYVMSWGRDPEVRTFFFLINMTRNNLPPVV